MVNWDDLRVFLAVQRGGAHAAAARTLGVDPTTVGRRVIALEAALGARLFRRTRAGLQVTEEGARMAAHAERVEAELFACERELGHASALAGTVRVTAGDGILTYMLVPALGSLFAAHPGLQIELRGDYRMLDLSRREADVALRLSRPREASLVGKRIGVVRLGLFATEAYLIRRGRPANEAALAEHDILTYDASIDHTPPMQWLRARAGSELRLRSSTTGAIVAACAAGQGIAFVIPAAARTVPGVVELFPRAAIPPREIWSVVHADMRRHRRVAAVLEWAAAAIAASGARPPPAG